MAAEDGAEYKPEQLPAIVAALEQEMKEAARALEFEKAAQLRDRILALKDLGLGLPAKAASGVKGLLGSGAFAGAAALGKLGGARRPQQRRRRR
jgi:excinuclease ABC subunit B